MNQDDCYREGFYGGFRPDPILTVSEWADTYRMLSQRASAEPGKWRTERTPYLKEIMDSLSAMSPVQSVTLIKGAQLGGTEAGSNWIGYIIDHAPGPVLAVQPTVEMAKRNSKQRIEPLIQESQRLREKVKSPRSRDSGNTILAKEFPGGLLVMTGANSAVGLRSLPARYLFLDEIDAYPGDVDGEGDPVSLAEARARTFARRKIFKVSTPTIEGRSRIQSSYEASDQRKYEVPCPHCSFFQELIWPRVKWEKGKISTAHYICAGCEQAIGEHHKTSMLSKGRWVAKNTNPNPRHVGFHLNSLYSPVGWFSWADAAELWELAQKNPDRLRSFVNTVLGETWKEKGDAPEWQRIFERRESHEFNRVPAGGIFITAGVDVQKDRLECEIVAWGEDRQSWSIDYRVVPGDTNEESPWNELFGFLNEQFTCETGGALPIRMMAIDSGYNTQIVYNQVRKHPINRVIAVKGSDFSQMVISSPSTVDVDFKGRKIRRGVKVWTVGSGIVKTELYGWLRLDKPTTEGEPYLAGYCHFPEYDEHYFKMLTAEQMVVRVTKSGGRRYEWEKIRERNEALDCRIYARAAAALSGLDRFTKDQWQVLKNQRSIEIGKTRPQNPSQDHQKKRKASPFLKQDRSFW
ncbi:MAG: phage tail protein [Deltaproteobacteria bacterium GWA2_45_12]|nr:MAG: phage tail protein [Deltaproteobacteria bacterium GWA2_45_12]